MRRGYSDYLFLLVIDSLYLCTQKYRYTNVDIETLDIVVLYHICLVLVVIAVGSQLKAGESYDMSTSFTNPLKKPLTNVVYFVEGAKLTVPLKEEGK